MHGLGPEPRSDSPAEGLDEMGENRCPLNHGEVLSYARARSTGKREEGIVIASFLPAYKARRVPGQRITPESAVFLSHPWLKHDIDSFRDDDSVNKIVLDGIAGDRRNWRHEAQRFV